MCDITDHTPRAFMLKKSPSIPLQAAFAVYRFVDHAKNSGPVPNPIPTPAAVRRLSEKILELQ